jgi:serine/threonine protein kinase
MLNEEPQEIWSYMPAGVQTIIAVGSTSFVGDLGNDQVLKYPHLAKDREAIEHEARVYNVLGSHRRILRCHGLDEAGLRLDKAANGTLRDFLKAQHGPRDKLKWSRQLAEAVEYIHTKQVFHCDISLRNCFVTDKCDLRLGDFQGRYRAPDGTVYDGNSWEGAKACLPRDPARVDHHSDLFAVGSAIYEIMTGHEPYEHLHSIDDLEEIEALFENRKFPRTDHILAHNVIESCWRQRYDSTEQCVRELAAIEAQYYSVTT